MKISGFPQKNPGFSQETPMGNAGSTDPGSVNAFRVFGFPRRIAPAVPVLGCGDMGISKKSIVGLI